MSMEKYTTGLDVCTPVATVFGSGPDAREIMGWPEAADDVTAAAAVVIGTYGWGERGTRPEQNALDRACGNCALRGCPVSTEISVLAQARPEHDPTMDELIDNAETGPFMRMPKIEAMRDLRTGQALYFPKGELPAVISTQEAVLPALDVTTPLGREVMLVPLYAANDKLYDMWASTIVAQPSTARDAIFRRTQELLIRVVDTAGGLGVHHINRTALPWPVYYPLNARPTTYITGLGEVEGKQAYGVLTATSTTKEQLELIKMIGGNTDRKRFRQG